MKNKFTLFNYLPMNLLVIFLLLLSNVAFSQRSLPASNENRNRLPVKLNGKWGYTDTTGCIVIEPRFASADFFSEGYAVVSIDGKFGYININGKEFIAPQFKEAALFQEGIATVKTDSLFCFIRKDGSILHCQRWCSRAGEGFLPFHIGSKWGYMDYNGKQIIPPLYDIAMPFADGLGCVGIKTADKWKYGFINTRGKVVVKIQLETWSTFSEGLAPVRLTNKFGFIDKKGRIIIPPQFDYAQGFRNGLAVVGEERRAASWEKSTGNENIQRSERWWLIDKKGNPVLSRKSDDLEYFHEGYAQFKEGNKWGYIDTTGRVVIEPRFDIACNFENGTAWVYLGGKGALIDRQGNVKNFPQFDDMSVLMNGFVMVVEGGTMSQWYDAYRSNNKVVKMGYLNRQGKLIWKPTN